MAVPIPEARIARFEKLGFGMFIHWGLYSQLGRGEWIMNLGKIPKQEYMKLKDTFTAKDFDARAITSLAKRAGMKYITLTTRHHDGFSLYDTCGLCDYDAPHSPANRDLVREFVDACRQDGILPVFYHTTLDWYQESFQEDFEGYLEYLRRSVEVLCTQYGEIGGLWFDGNWSKPGADWQEDKLYGMIRRLQPEAMIINNTGLDNLGRLGHPQLDSVTFEQHHPKKLNQEGFPKYLAAEMCQTINAHWGIGSRDFAYKSVGELIRTLCIARSAGANYLLNVGPDAQGAIPALESAMLEKVGEWISLFGNSIYEGKPSDAVCDGEDFVLDTPQSSYWYVHSLNIRGDANVTVDPKDSGAHRTIRNLFRPIASICWEDSGEALWFEQDVKTGEVHIDPTGFPYGTNTVVRVAQIAYRD